MKEYRCVPMKGIQYSNFLFAMCPQLEEMSSFMQTIFDFMWKTIAWNYPLGEHLSIGFRSYG